MKTKIIIGRSDKVDLPDLNIENGQAKIDTGAYTSALHCKKIQLQDGLLSFSIPIYSSVKTIVKKFETREFYQKKVRSSNGEFQFRFVIKTHIVIFKKKYLAEFSLSDRSQMKNPILIGRKLLKKRFIVDVSLENLSFDSKKSQQ